MARVNLMDEYGRVMELAIEPTDYEQPRFRDPADGAIKSAKDMGWHLGTFVESPAVAFREGREAPEPGSAAAEKPKADAETPTLTPNTPRDVPQRPNARGSAGVVRAKAEDE